MKGSTIALIAGGGIVAYVLWQMYQNNSQNGQQTFINPLTGQPFGPFINQLANDAIDPLQTNNPGPMNTYDQSQNDTLDATGSTGVYGSLPSTMTRY